MLLTACSRRSLHAVPSRVPCLPCPPVLAFLAGSRWWFLSLGSGCLCLSLPAWPSLVWGREARTDLASAEPRGRRAQAQALSFAGSGPLLTWAAGARALPGWRGPIGKDFLCDLTSLFVTSSPLAPPFVAELRGQLCSPALLLLSMAEAFPALGTGGAATRPSALLSSVLSSLALPYDSSPFSPCLSLPTQTHTATLGERTSFPMSRDPRATGCPDMGPVGSCLSRPITPEGLLVETY